MLKDLSGYRDKYLKGELNENDLPDNPFVLFSKWFDEIEKFGTEIESNAMSLSTVSSDFSPITRIVLLKKFSESGFVFFTNYNSRKGKNISVNSNVCLSFYWPSMERQVIIQGIARKISENDSIDYFNSRPESSRVGAIVSNQSEVIPSRNYIDEKLNNFLLNNKKLIKPENWGGFNVVPSSIEFWQGRDNRLHDRIIFFNENNNWVNKRLSP
jgi:pyridoxamine 5'-phosphate oxidase